MSDRQKLIYLALLFIWLPFLIQAQQNSCAGKLDSARTLYENGLIEDVPSTLWPCIEEGFTREERISAYKLLVLTYLFDDNQVEAEKTMKLFIFDYPNYDIRPDDPVEFVYLFESYESVPKFSFGVRAGANMVQPYQINYKSMGISSSHELRYHFGVQAALQASVYLNRNLAINLEGEIYQSTHEFVNKIDNISRVSFDETQTRIQIPLFVSYQFSGELIYPFFFVGGSTDFLISAKGVPTRKIDSPSNPQTIIGPELDMLNQRNNFDVSILVGGGFHYPLTKGSIFIDVRAGAGFFNQSLGNIYQEPLLWSGYYHLDNDYSLIRYSISAGYVYSFYKPEKIK